MGAANSESALENHYLARTFLPGKALELGEVAELRVLFSLRNIDDRMKIHHPSLQPVYVPNDAVSSPTRGRRSHRVTAPGPAQRLRSR